MDTLLELIEANYTLVLLKLIHLLIIRLFFDDFYEGIELLLRLLYLLLLFFLLSDLVHDVLLVPLLPHANSHNANSTNANEHSHKNEKH